MDSHPSSDVAAPGIRVYGTDETRLSEPVEWRPLLIEVRVPVARWEDVRVDRNGERLPVSLRRFAGRPRVLADWPRSGPGRYRLRVVLDGATTELDLDVRPAKLSADDFARLIDDLQSALPLSIAV